MKLDVLALGIDAEQVVTVADDRSDMSGVDQPAVWWDADVVDPELAQIVRHARACEALGIDSDCGGEQ